MKCTLELGGSSRVRVEKNSKHNERETVLDYSSVAGKN